MGEGGGGGREEWWVVSYYCENILPEFYFNHYFLLVNYSAPDPWDVAPLQVLPTQQPHPPSHSQSCWDTGQ